MSRWIYAILLAIFGIGHLGIATAQVCEGLNDHRCVYMEDEVCRPIDTRANNRIIYLFGAVHDTEEALSQENEIAEYAKMSKVMFAQEGVSFELNTLEKENGSLLKIPNAVGIENSVLFGAQILFFALANYCCIHFEGIGLHDYDKPWRKSTVAELEIMEASAQREVKMFFETLLNPGWDIFFEDLKHHKGEVERSDFLRMQHVSAFVAFVYSDSKLTPSICLEGIEPLKILLRNHLLLYDQDAWLYEAKRFAKLMSEQFIQRLTLIEKIQVLATWGRLIMPYLSEITLPDGSRMPQSLIEVCHNFINYEGLPATFINPKLLNLFTPLRDHYIAHHLEKIYPVAAERGLQLVGVVGNKHLLSLQEKLEAKGFTVIINNMPALKASWEDKH